VACIGYEATLEWVAEAGIDEVIMNFRQANNGGKFRVGTATASNGVYDESVFAEQTCYAANPALPAAVNLGTRTFKAPGQYWFRFRVTAAGADAGAGRNLFQG
jgi:hypothetical protein